MTTTTPDWVRHDARPIRVTDVKVGDRIGNASGCWLRDHENIRRVVEVCHLDNGRVRITTTTGDPVTHGPFDRVFINRVIDRRPPQHPRVPPTPVTPEDPSPKKRDKRRDLRQRITALERDLSERDHMIAEMRQRPVPPELFELEAELTSWLENNANFQADRAKDGNHLSAFRAQERAVAINRVISMIDRLKRGQPARNPLLSAGSLTWPPFGPLV